MDNVETLDDLTAALRSFARERDWEKFHSPKNLSMALAIEAAELMEPLQWLSGDESADAGTLDVEHIRHEMGDVLIYLVRLADQLDIDLIAAAVEKLRLNEAKYPASQVRGSARKYTEY